MLVEHALTITAFCPKDLKQDYYQCLLRTRRLLLVERIHEVTLNLSREALYQEDLTTRLQRELACQVLTWGEHSGVQTFVLCGEP